MDQKSLKELIAYTKTYGFIFPSSDIYEGLSAVYDYGPLGVLLKEKIKTYWWKAMVQLHSNIVGIDSAIFMHPRIWKASGHTDGFNDLMIDNKDSKKRYRVDTLIEDYIERIAKKNTALAKVINEDLEACMGNDDLKGLYTLIDKHQIPCPFSGSKKWSSVKRFNLMFETQIGSTQEGSQNLYLRPETAQGIFVNFLQVQKSSRLKIPFGIAQIGKAFRNEIIARQFIFRMKEFEQMEMQFFVQPEKQMEFYQQWKEKRMRWHKSLNMPLASYRFKDHVNLAHYASAASDIEFNFSIGYKEIEGIHCRTDFDLKNHQTFSNKKLQYFDTKQNVNYIPYVIETSLGLDRMFLSILSGCLQEEDYHTTDKKESRLVLKIPAGLAPIQLAILPLTKKDGLPELADKIYQDLCSDFQIQYDEKDSIGRRYRRQDAIGTPYCITVDYQSISDHTVTLRQRDTMEQKRISIAHIKELIEKPLSSIQLLKNL